MSPDSSALASATLRQLCPSLDFQAFVVWTWMYSGLSQHDITLNGVTTGCGVAITKCISGQHDHRHESNPGDSNDHRMFH